MINNSLPPPEAIFWHEVRCELQDKFSYPEDDALMALTWFWSEFPDHYHPDRRDAEDTAKQIAVATMLKELYS